MKKLLRKFLLAGVFALAFTVFSGNTAKAEAAKEMTYREQNETTDTNLVFLKVGEKIDLKFVGASDYKSYDQRRWVSTNTKVATVDKTGVITANSEGVTVISYVMNDGGKYISKGCTVVVSKQYEAISLNVNGEKTSQVEMEVGDIVRVEISNYNSFKSGTFYGRWYVADEDVAIVTSTGIVTAVANGSTLLMYEAVDCNTGVTLPCEAILFRVGTGVKDDKVDKEEVKPTVTPTVTPKSTVTPKPTVTLKPTAAPTKAPNQGSSATPTPTPKPDVTVTPTPTPVPASFTVNVIDEKQLVVSYDRSLGLTERSLIVTQGSTSLELEKIEWSADYSYALVTVKDYLYKGTTYNVVSNTRSASVTTQFGVPTDVELTYESLGRKGAAFAMDNNGTDIPVKLGVKLLSNGMDVTNNYLNEGYVEYYVENTDVVNFDFNVDEIRFYEANVLAKISAKYTCWTKNNEEINLRTGIVTLRSTKAPTYLISELLNWTLVPTNSSAKVDWSNVNQTVVAGSGTEYQIIALIRDSYGYTYATDDRGVTSKDIRSISEYGTPLYGHSCFVSFEGGNSEDYYTVTSNGYVYAYKQTGSAPVILKYTDSEGRTVAFGKVNLRIGKEAVLTKLVATTQDLTLSTGSVSGSLNGVTCDKVGIIPYDQYDKKWTGDMNISITTSNSLVNKELSNGFGGIYYSNGYLYVDAVQLRTIGTMSSIRIAVKDDTTRASVSIDVKLLDPAYDKDGNIVISSWTLGESKTVSNIPSEEQIVRGFMTYPIDIFRISRSNVKVDKVVSNIKLQTSSSMKFDSTNCEEGDFFLYVTGPRGAVVSEVSDTQKYGLHQVATGGCYELVFGSDEGNGKFSTMDPGTYNIQVTYIQSIDENGNARTSKKSLPLTLSSSAPSVIVKGCEAEYSTKVSDAETAKACAASCLTLSVNGEEWIGFNASYITEVKYSAYTGRCVINTVTLWVPVNEDCTAYTLVKLNVNRTVKVPVN